METLKVSPQNLNVAVKKALKVIKNGGIVVCPTDTVYGLLVDIRNEKAVQKILNFKKRSSKKPIPVFVNNLKMAKSLAYINKTQERFLKKVWPGKTTAVLKAKPGFSQGILSKDKKIGLRIPNYKFLNILLEKLNCPLTGTSANISGKPASLKIKDVLKHFKNQKYQPDLILDAGNLKPSLPSTVIDMEENKILRKGELSKKEILAILAKIS